MFSWPEAAEIKGFHCFFLPISQRLHQIKTQEFKDPLQQGTHGSKVVVYHSLVGTDILLS